MAFQSKADRGQAPVSVPQGAHASPYLAIEARRRVDLSDPVPRSTTAVPSFYAQAPNTIHPPITSAQLSRKFLRRGISMLPSSLVAIVFRRRFEQFQSSVGCIAAASLA